MSLVGHPQRPQSQARESKANAVVGIRTTILPWHGTHEMLMTGTAARNPALPPEADRAPVTSDLTGEELWAMTSLGYAPAKLLMSTSIYSLGLVGGFLAASKSFSKGEVTELTTLIHDAREVAISRLKNEADLLKAEDVVGVKTYIAELGGGLVEFMTIGTAIKKLQGVAVASPALPPHAIVHGSRTLIRYVFWRNWGEWPRLKHLQTLGGPSLRVWFTPACRRQARLRLPFRQRHLDRRRLRLLPGL